MPLEKMRCGENYTANKIKDNINELIDVVDSASPSASQILFDRQASESIGMTYIVSGDSNRDNSYNEMIAYYGELLGQIGVSVVNNSSSGQSGKDWFDGVTGTTLQEAIDATPGAGSATLLEYSFGPNDSGTDEEIKAVLKGGIEAYMSAKPEATVVLCSPVRTRDKYGVLIGLYEEIASELGLQLVKPHPVIEPYDNDPLFKQDTAHLNKYGCQRLLHFILSNIVSEKVRSSISIPDLGVTTPPETNLAVSVLPDYYSVATGGVVTLSTWRRSDKISVEPNYKINIEHKGESNKVFWYEEDGTYLLSTSSSLVSGDLRQVTVPPDAYLMAFNITGDGDAWDALGFTPVVEYNIENLTYLTPEEVNVNMASGLPRFNTLPVDSDGKTGVHGQFLMSLGATKTKWLTPVVVSTSPPTGTPAEGELVYHYVNNNAVNTYVNVNGAYVPSVQ